MLHFVFIFFPIVATVWAMFKMRGIRAKERKVIIVVLLGLCAAHYGIQDFLVHNGHYPFVGAKFIHDFTSTLLLPLVHLLFCYSLGITSELRFLRILLLLCLFMVPDLIVVLSVPTEVEFVTIDDRFNYLHLQFTEDFGLTMDIYVLVVVVQLIIEIQRISVMRRIFKRRDLYLSRGGRWVMRCTACTAIWIIITLIPTHQFKMEHISAMNFILMGTSAFMTLIFLMITLYFNNEIVVSADNKPVAIEKDPDVDLAASLQKLLEEKKVYLNSSLHIEDVASMLMTNRTYVARVCKSKYNMTFTELMNRSRVNYAKALLLADEHRRIEDIAAESGFSSGSFFTRVFKLYVGVTPSQWRTIELEKRAAKLLEEKKQLHDGMTTEEALMVETREVKEATHEESESNKVNKIGGDFLRS